MTDLSYIFILTFSVLSVTALACFLQFSARKAIYGLFFLSLAGLQANWGLIQLGILPENSNLFVTVPILLFIYSPTMYFSALFSLDDTSQLEPKDILHFIPLFIVAGLSIPFYLIPYETKRLAIQSMVDAGQIIPQVYVYYPGDLKTIVSIAIIARLLYWIRIWQTFGDFRIGLPSALFLCVRVLAILNILVSPLILISLLANDLQYFMATMLLGGVCILVFFAITQIYPLVGQGVTVLTKTRKAMLESVSEKEIEPKLTDLMSNQNIYTDNELTLKKMADQLQVTPHELSAYINQVKKTNFNSFVNFYRVAAAKKGLLRNDIHSTFEIGREVGFSTRATFANVFKQHTGYTPKQYRRKHIS